MLLVVVVVVVVIVVVVVVVVVERSHSEQSQYAQETLKYSRMVTRPIKKCISGSDHTKLSMDLLLIRIIVV